MFCCLRTLGTFRTVLLVLTVRRIIFFLRTCSHSRHPSRGRRSCGNCRCRWSTFPACAVLARCRRAVSAGGGRPFLRCDTFCIFPCDDLSNSFQLLTPPLPRLPAPLRGGGWGRGERRGELLTPPLPLPYMGGECPAAGFSRRRAPATPRPSRGGVGGGVCSFLLRRLSVSSSGSMASRDDCLFIVIISF